MPQIVGFLSGTLRLLSLLVLVALVLNAPLLLAAWYGRRRLPPVVPRVVLALGLAVASSCLLWRMEWFDVWRFGVPSVAYIVKAYVPWVVAVAVAGWLAGAACAGRVGRRGSYTATRGEKRLGRRSVGARHQVEPRS